jgi:hypothetical protein
VELEETVGYFGTTLSAENKHRFPGNGYRKVAASWWTSSHLLDILPSLHVSRLKNGVLKILPKISLTFNIYLERNCPHVIQTSVSVIASKNPKLVVEYGSTVSRSRNWGPVVSRMY